VDGRERDRRAELDTLEQQDDDEEDRGRDGTDKLPLHPQEVGQDWVCQFALRSSPSAPTVPPSGTGCACATGGGGEAIATAVPNVVREPAAGTGRGCGRGEVCTVTFPGAVIDESFVNKVNIDVGSFCVVVTVTDDSYQPTRIEALTAGAALSVNKTKAKFSRKKGTLTISLYYEEE
jgi:hypothetical protein